MSTFKKSNHILKYFMFIFKIFSMKKLTIISSSDCDLDVEGCNKLGLLSPGLSSRISLCTSKDGLFYKLQIGNVRNIRITRFTRITRITKITRITRITRIMASHTQWTCKEYTVVYKDYFCSNIFNY